MCKENSLFFWFAGHKKKILNVYSKKNVSNKQAVVPKNIVCHIQYNSNSRHTSCAVIGQLLQPVWTEKQNKKFNCVGTEGPRANLCGPTKHLKNLKIKKENIFSFG